MKSPENGISTDSTQREKKILAFACYREQNRATVPRNIIGDQILNQLDIPFISYRSVGNRTFADGVSRGTRVE